jgi:hypothetical protein
LDGGDLSNLEVRLGLQPSIAQVIDPVKTIENLIVMGHCNKCGVLLNRNYSKQTHDDLHAL